MLSMLKNLFGISGDQRQWMDVYTELKKNLEIFHVMDQRQFMDMEFQITVWNKARETSGIKFPDEMIRYAETVREFNRAFREFKDYEKWYAADMARKTKENAQKLHTQKNELELKLKAIYPVMCQAGSAVELKLIAMGLIDK